MSTFYSLTTGTLPASLKAFFEAIQSYIPGPVTITCEGSGDEIEDSTGALMGGFSAADQAPTAGENYGVYAAPAGLSLAWLTDTVLDGHRVKGRTYLVPLGSSIFQANGSLTDGIQGAFETAANALIQAEIGNMVVWHRPRVARAADGSRPAIAARAGGHGVITGSSVRDTVAVLTSRRD